MSCQATSSLESDGRRLLGSQLNDLRHMSQAWFPSMLTLRVFQERHRWELSGAVPACVKEVELRVGRCPEVSAVSACTCGSLWWGSCPGLGERGWLSWAAAVLWPPNSLFPEGRSNGTHSNLRLRNRTPPPPTPWLTRYLLVMTPE